MAPRRKPAATFVRMRLYKVLTADGRSPYQPGPVWSLPTQNADGTWTPGEWQENPEGLYVTASPDHHDTEGRVVYEAEAGAGPGDIFRGDVVASRVRLLRRLAPAEIGPESHMNRVAVSTAYRLEEQRERMEKVRKAATQKVAERAAAREAGVTSPALCALQMLADLLPKRAGLRDASNARHAALVFAVQWLRFDAEDFETLASDSRRELGVSADSAENYLALAIESGNTSACVALERAIGRRAWWARGRSGERIRLCSGARFWVRGTEWRVASFRDTHLNARPESGGKLTRFTREELEGKAPRGKEAA